MTDKKQKLTPKQQRFVSEYLKTGNATEAAKAAGYKGNNNTLRVVGAENLTKPNVIEAIEKRNAKRNERFELEEDYELRMLHQISEECWAVKDYQNANAALKIMAQIRGKFIRKVQVGFADSLAEQLEDVGE